MMTPVSPFRSLPRPRPRPAPALAALLLLLAAHSANGAPVWSEHGGSPQHGNLSGVAAQPLQQVLWQMPVDLAPQYSDNDLLIHYGSPLVTALNTIIVPVKVGVTDTFRVEARVGRTGTLLWLKQSDYVLPVHRWTPSYTPALTPAGRLYLPAAGGTLLYTDQADAPGTPVFTRIAFYGTANYTANPAAFANVRICTPLTTDALGNVFFGFMTSGSNPLGITSGIARVGADGACTYVTAFAATAGVDPIPLLNCAPVLSNDGRTLYVVFRHLLNDWQAGALLALDATTLSTVALRQVLDPHSALPALFADDGSAAPTVGPDGRIFFGVLENPFGVNASRGWLLQFHPDLSLAGAPGDFGWDETPSIVPRALVPAYTGASAYLLMSKYNRYAGAFFGDGVNRLAILDPNATQVDPATGTTVMKEVLTITGVTPDSANIATYPYAVKEWCINAAVVDSATHSVLAGNEDGRLYRWDLASNTFSEAITLTPGVGEAYTPTVIGADGRVYAINNATLFSVGLAGTAAAPQAPGPDPGLRFATAGANPFTGHATFRLSLPASACVRLEIVDTAGRRIATLADGVLEPGDRVVRWDGRDARGSASPAGVYFARLTAGATAISRKVVLAR